MSGLASAGLSPPPACSQACKFIDEHLAIKTSTLPKETLVNCAKTSMSSKITGVEDNFFAQMVVAAITAVKSTDDTGKVKYPVKAINVLKAHGKGARESVMLDGYALNMARAAQGMPRRVLKARIACLDMNLQKARMMMGVQVSALVHDTNKLVIGGLSLRRACAQSHAHTHTHTHAHAHTYTRACTHTHAHTHARSYLKSWQAKAKTRLRSQPRYRLVCTGVPPPKVCPCGDLTGSGRDLAWFSGV